MIYSSKWSILAAIILCLVVFAPFVKAQTPFDITYCGAGAMTMVSASKELTVFGYDFKSIVQSHHENKALDNCTFHAVGVKKLISGKQDETGYFKLMDTDGDFIIGEVTRVGEEEGIWKFLQGTGKWKGIKGSGKHSHTAGGKPIVPGTAQSCSRNVGTFELPK